MFLDRKWVSGVLRTMTPNVAHRVRTTFVLGAAGATVIAALLLTGRMPQGPTVGAAPVNDDGLTLTAKFTSQQILSRDSEQFVRSRKSRRQGTRSQLVIRLI